MMLLHEANEYLQKLCDDANKLETAPDGVGIVAYNLIEKILGGFEDDQSLADQLFRVLMLDDKWTVERAAKAYEAAKLLLS